MPIDKTLGYEFIYSPSHPMANASGKVYVHRIVMSEHFGRLLLPGEHVHHIDGNRQNNSVNNLVLLSNSEHSRLHQREKGNGTDFFDCTVCKTKTRNKKFCSQKCAHFFTRRVERPSLETLIKDTETMSMLAIGRKYGVSDNAIRKWLKQCRL